MIYLLKDVGPGAAPAGEDAADAAAPGRHERRRKRRLQTKDDLSSGDLQCFQHTQRVPTRPSLCQGRAAGLVALLAAILHQSHIGGSGTDLPAEACWSAPAKAAAPADANCVFTYTVCFHCQSASYRATRVYQLLEFTGSYR